jgi:integrase/recombinase XerC/integrase/recombinase XerD
MVQAAENPQPHQVYTLVETYSLFELDNRARRLSPRTLEHHAFYLGRFFAWCEGQSVTHLHQVTPVHLRAYLVFLQEQEWSDWSIHGAARDLRRFFRFCLAEGLIAVSPMTRVKMPRTPRTILPAFTAEDVDKLLAAANTQRDKALLLFLLDTGARAAECAALNLADVDPRTGVVHIRHGKGDKARYVFMGGRTSKAIMRYTMGRERSSGAALWLTDAGGRLTLEGLRMVLRRVGKRAGVDHCHPHTFRRTFALWSLRAGMSIYHLQRLMGHADITVLRQYLDLVTEDVQAAHQAAGIVDRLK